MLADREKLKSFLQDPRPRIGDEERLFLEKSIDEMDDDQVVTWLTAWSVLKQTGRHPLNDLMEDRLRPHVSATLRKAGKPLTRAELVDCLRESTGITAPARETVDRVIIHLLTHGSLKLALG